MGEALLIFLTSLNEILKDVGMCKNLTPVQLKKWNCVNLFVVANKWQVGAIHETAWLNNDFSKAFNVNDINLLGVLSRLMY